MRSLLPEVIGQLALWQAGPFVLCSFRFGLIEGPDFLNMKVLRKAFYFRCHGLKTLFELQSMHFVPASKTISHRLQTSLLIGPYPAMRWRIARMSAFLARCVLAKRTPTINPFRQAGLEFTKLGDKMS